MSLFERSKRPFAASSCAVLALAIAVPAHALTATTLPLGMSSVQAGACAPFAPTASVLAQTGDARALKTEAILGGAPSALEQIRLSQAAAANNVAQLSAETPSQPAPATGSVCYAGAWSPSDSVSEPAALAGSAYGASSYSGRRDMFLGSARIAIGKTRFDGDWARVASRHLTTEQVERTMGARASDRVALIGQVNR